MFRVVFLFFCFFALRTHIVIWPVMVLCFAVWTHLLSNQTFLYTQINLRVCFSIHIHLILNY